MAKKKASSQGKAKRSSAAAGQTNDRSVDEQEDFESALGDVERIVARLESGELGLSESLEQYERGIKRLKRCHQLLDAAQQKITLLSGFDADGNPVSEPLPTDSPAKSDPPELF